MAKRVALVTGGTRGIGLGIAKSLTAEGFSIVTCGIRPESAVLSVLAELTDLGADVLYCQADVSDPDARARMLPRIKDRFGRLDVLVNNAGVAPKVRADMLDATEESFERVLHINLQGPYFLTQAVARWMIKQGREDKSFQACVINISSISATAASTNRGEYCISKAGVSMATNLWAVRLAEFNIPVYEVRPGIIKTDMTQAASDKYDRLIREGLTLQRRWGLPEDVGRAVATLVRGDLPYSTGQVIKVDGGMTIPTL